MGIKRYGNRGISSINGEAAVTFEILGATDQLELQSEKAQYDMLGKFGDAFELGEFTIAAYGDTNKLPQEVRNLIKNNYLLPEILKKQVRFLYGQGPFLFREEFDDDNQKKRLPVKDQRKEYADVFAWLESWKKNGLKQSFEEYAKQVIMEYYYTEGVWTKWRFNLSRRIGGALPVRGLEYIPSTKCRYAFKGKIDRMEDLEDEDLNLVLYGRWDNPYYYNMKEFPRFSEADPFKHGVSISYVRDFGFSEEIYSFPTYYYGLKDWIKGSNLNPKYINSYLKNSLNAKLHVLIPDSWITQKEATLNEICEKNTTRERDGVELITEYEGVKDLGTRFNYGMVQKLIDEKIRLVTEVLSGEGKNQGKVFVSRKFQTQHGIEEWEFKEIPTKYKEFIESILDYEKQAIKSIIAGKGLDPSISNVGAEGIFNNSGSQVYYNYLLYLQTLTYPEEFCTHDINLALRLNFPRLESEGIKLGFFRSVPERLENTDPEARPQNTTKNA